MSKNKPATWVLLDKLIALIGGIIAGTATHYVSRTLGIEVTTPGVIVASAGAAVSLSFIHWTTERPW